MPADVFLRVRPVAADDPVKGVAHGVNEVVDPARIAGDKVPVGLPYSTVEYHRKRLQELTREFLKHPIRTGLTAGQPDRGGPCTTVPLLRDLLHVRKIPLKIDGFIDGSSGIIILRYHSSNIIKGKGNPLPRKNHGHKNENKCHFTVDFWQLEVYYYCV